MIDQRMEDKYQFIQKTRIKARWEVCWMILERDKRLDSSNDKEISLLDDAWRQMDLFLRDIVKMIPSDKPFPDKEPFPEYKPF